MEEKKIDYLKEDPEVPNQQIALVSMIEPQNSRMLMNKESFLATKFIDKFLKDYIQARDYINKEGEDKMTDIIKEKLDLSYENVRDRYYDWKKISLNDHEKEFDKKYNENREPTVTGFKVRGAYPNILVAKEKAKDDRLNKQSTHQAELIQQRKQDTSPKDFTGSQNTDEMMDQMMG